MAEGVISTSPATPIAGITAATRSLPKTSAIRIESTHAWYQLWLVYFLRDRPLSVPHPSVFLTGFGVGPERLNRFDAPAAYEVGPAGPRPAVWRRHGLTLYAVK